jgi:hypothetical protein
MIVYKTYEESLKDSFCDKISRVIDMPNIITLKELKFVNVHKYNSLLSYFTELGKFYGKNVVVFEDSHIDFTKARGTESPIVSFKLKFKYNCGNIQHTKELNNDFCALDIPYSILSAFA